MFLLSAVFYLGIDVQVCGRPAFLNLYLSWKVIHHLPSLPFFSRRFFVSHIYIYININNDKIIEEECEAHLETKYVITLVHHSKSYEKIGEKRALPRSHKKKNHGKWELKYMNLNLETSFLIR